MQDTKFRNISIIGDGGMATVMAILLCEKKIADSGQRIADSNSVEQMEEECEDDEITPCLSQEES